MFSNWINEIHRINWINLFFSNFGLSMFVLATLFIIIHKLLKRKAASQSQYDIVYRWTALLPLGVTAIFAFIMHAFFQDFTAATIGWMNSPFQLEVAMANLGFGIIAILSFYPNYGFRLATVIGNTFWLWGDAIGHVYQMIVHHNFTIGNAGSWLWMDILIPLILIYCIIKLKPERSLPVHKSTSKVLHI